MEIIEKHGDRASWIDSLSGLWKDKLDAWCDALLGVVMFLVNRLQLLKFVQRWKHPGQVSTLKWPQLYLHVEMFATRQRLGFQASKMSLRRGKKVLLPFRDAFKRKPELQAATRGDRTWRRSEYCSSIQISRVQNALETCHIVRLHRIHVKANFHRMQTCRPFHQQLVVSWNKSSWRTRKKAWGCLVWRNKASLRASMVPAINASCDVIKVLEGRHASASANPRGDCGSPIYWTLDQLGAIVGKEKSRNMWTVFPLLTTCEKVDRMTFSSSLENKGIALGAALEPNSNFTNLCVFISSSKDLFGALFSFMSSQTWETRFGPCQFPEKSERKCSRLVSHPPSKCWIASSFHYQPRETIKQMLKEEIVKLPCPQTY